MVRDCEFNDIIQIIMKVYPGTSQKSINKIAVRFTRTVLYRRSQLLLLILPEKFSPYGSPRCSLTGYGSTLFRARFRSTAARSGFFAPYCQRENLGRRISVDKGARRCLLSHKARPAGDSRRTAVGWSVGRSLDGRTTRTTGP